MKKVWISWSSGKDSAWTLHHLNQGRRYQVTGLFTTINEAFDRVAMHGVRRALAEAQAAAAGLPLRVIPLPWPCSNAVYESRVANIWEQASDDGAQAIAFGDLFLSDVRQYRITLLENTGLGPVFPLWQMPTASLAREMIESGLEARITCVDPRKLNRSFAGRERWTPLTGPLGGISKVDSVVLVAASQGNSERGRARGRGPTQISCPSQCTPLPASLRCVPSEVSRCCID